MTGQSELEGALAGLQAANQQLQNIMIQKQTMQIQLMEVNKAAEELEKTKDDVYRSVGPILVKSKREDVKKEIDELKEQIELRLKSTEKQETRLKEKMSAGQQKFQELMGSQKNIVGG